MKRLLASLIACAIALTACGSGSSPQPSADGAREIAKPRHRRADHQVIVVLGKDYASRPAVIEPLVSEYGLAGSGGMVMRLDYPDSFMDGKAARLSVLSEKAQDPQVTTIVAVGAPEGLTGELRKIREANPSIRIANLFQNDDPLRAESISDLFVDFPLSQDMLASENATSQGSSSLMTDQAVGCLILASTLSVEGSSKADTPLARLDECVGTACSSMRIRKADFPFSLSNFVDPETSLRSRNHVVLDPTGGVAR